MRKFAYFRTGHSKSASEIHTTCDQADRFPTQYWLHHVRVLSDRFEFSCHVCDTLGLDFAFSVALEDFQKVFFSPPVPSAMLRMLTRNVHFCWAWRQRPSKEEILAVGMVPTISHVMHWASLSVSFSAEPMVQKQKQVRLDQPTVFVECRSLSLLF